MKRYNQKDGIYPMVEDKDGYWVTYEDYNRCILDNNKLVEKSWRARDSLASVNDEKVEKLQHYIVRLSVVSFVAISILIFIGLS